MASSAYNKAFAVREAAILTTGEVNGTSFDLNNANNSEVVAEISFTLGSLTNGIFRVYASVDGTNFFKLTDSSGAAIALTLTASNSLAVPLRAGGFKFLRISVQGTGTVTSSSATVNLRYLRRGAQRM